MGRTSGGSGSGGGGGKGAILAYSNYAPGTVQTYTLGAGLTAAVDTTNASLSFVAPASGFVLLSARMLLLTPTSVNAAFYWAAHGSSVQATDFEFITTAVAWETVTTEVLLGGLTGGNTVHYDLWWFNGGTAGGLEISAGGYTAGSFPPATLTQAPLICKAVQA